MIGLSSYAYQWRLDASADDRWTVERVIEDAARLEVGLVQLCDLPELDRLAAEGLSRIRLAQRERLPQLRRLGDELGVSFEVGTKGIAPEHLLAYLDIAFELGSPLVRSMLVTPAHRPTPAEAEAALRSVLPAYEAAGVTLALETYEQVATADLVDLVATIDSPGLGICLDPGNVVARLEHPADVVAMTVPWVRNLHVKDFAFTRSPDMVGFRFAGVPLGEGLLDYDGLVAAVDPSRRGISRIIEQWVPWQGDSARTITLETRWAEHALHWLRAADARAAAAGGGVSG
ncbi:TIM barrel protein [Herbiconiux sp. KACC 21604]|uniref:sugar phosphate isomerase/epimerase family protein n=1 Tax=unclassified Herbiconiux TaxID=2618217 RepID=UPI001C11FEBB|nr:TIM barrel protein [Herbiconiux sp. SALV-R1]WPO86124.1 TIM barrel protein [Herbiconiux sp. KACC 21604]